MKQLKNLLIHRQDTGRILLLGILLMSLCNTLQAQEINLLEPTDSVFPVDSIVLQQEILTFEGDSIISESDSVTFATDSMVVIIPNEAATDSIIREVHLIADSTIYITNNSVVDMPLKKTFKPNSTRAVLYSAIFPGLGQIYNRKYWKLPLVYGGYMGFMYAITWNNRMYSDYYNAYMDIMDDSLNRPEADPSQWSENWKVFIPRGDYENYITNDTFHNQLKRRKDYYRRYRDLSIILTVGFYAICMIDAYVDAELFDFDISENLSMRVEPLIMPRTQVNQWSFGLNYCLTF